MKLRLREGVEISAGILLLGLAIAMLSFIALAWIAGFIGSGL